MYLCFVLFQPVEGWQVSPSTLKLPPSSLLYLRFVLLQPVEGCQPLTFVDWVTPTPSDWESTLETLEIRQSTLKPLETLETLALLESPCSLRQA